MMSNKTPLKLEECKIGMRVKIHISRGDDYIYQANATLVITKFKKNYVLCTSPELKWTDYGVWPHHLYRATPKPTIIVTED